MRADTLETCARETIDFLVSAVGERGRTGAFLDLHQTFQDPTYGADYLSALIAAAVLALADKDSV
jgi:hypothetical protein